MPRALASRIGHALAVIVLSVSISFLVLHLVPGDPLATMIEQAGRSDAARAVLRARYGLDQSLLMQFGRFWTNLLRGDLGSSLGSGQPVATLIANALANSLTLGALSVVAACLIGLAVGSAEGWWPHSRKTRLLGATLTALYAVPEFVIASMVIGVLAYRTGWFPVGGMSDPTLQYSGSTAEQWVDRARHLVLPTLTLAIGWSASIARQQRRALRDIAREPFVRTALAKGLTSRATLWRHALRPALPSVVATVGLLIPALVGGAVVVELVFSWPGLGSLLVQSIGARDYPVVTGVMLVVGSLVAIGVLFVDVVLWRLDPRLRRSSEATV